VTDLERELRYAAEDAIIGQPLRSGLAQRAHSAVRAVLHRHRIRNARISVRQQGAGFYVEVSIPPGPGRVEVIVIRFAPA
jgi:hypothetical protein